MKTRIKSHKWIFISCITLLLILILIYPAAFLLNKFALSWNTELFDQIPFNEDNWIYENDYRNGEPGKDDTYYWFRNIKDKDDILDLKWKNHKRLKNNKYLELLYVKLNFFRWFLIDWEYVNPKTLEPCWKELNKIDWTSVLSWEYKVINISDYINLWKIDLNKVALYNDTDKNYILTFGYSSEPEEYEYELESWMPFVTMEAPDYITIK